MSPSKYSSLIGVAALAFMVSLPDFVSSRDGSGDGRGGGDRGSDGGGNGAGAAGSSDSVGAAAGGGSVASGGRGSDGQSNGGQSSGAAVVLRQFGRALAVSAASGGAWRDDRQRRWFRRQPRAGRRSRIERRRPKCRRVRSPRGTSATRPGRRRSAGVYRVRRRRRARAAAGGGVTGPTGAGGGRSTSGVSGGTTIGGFGASSGTLGPARRPAQPGVRTRDRPPAGHPKPRVRLA